MIKKELPVNYPPITSWAWVADLLSVLTTKEESYSWIYTNYIQLSCRQDTSSRDGMLFLDFIPSNSSSIIDCPLIDVKTVDRGSILKTEKNIKDYFIDIIDDNYYLYAYFNMQKIIDKINRYFIHQFFIYGYNKKEQSFNVADFLFNKIGRKYTFELVEMKRVCDGLNDVKKGDGNFLGNKGDIILFRHRKKFEYFFNPRLVASYLYNYIHPQYFCDFYDVRFNPEARTVYGIDVYEMIIESMESLRKEGVYDVKTLHNLYDHKILMILRIEYMVKEGYIEMDRSLIDDFVDIKNKIEKIYLLCMKLDITKYTKIEKTEYIISELKDIKNKEISIYQLVIEKLLTYNTTGKTIKQRDLH